MRTLTAALTAAQKSASASPYVRVRAIRKIGGVGRLDWTRLYTGAEPETSHGATHPADGSLVRIRVESGTAYIQRIATPGPTSDFATWTYFDSPDLTPIAICSSGTTVWAFYVKNGEIWARLSTDSGATFAASVLIANAATVPTVIAAAMKPNGDVLVVFNRGASVRTIKRSGGAWGAEIAWSNSAASITGVAVCYSNDYNLIVTGTEVTTAHPRVWSCMYGDGYSQGADTWSSLFEITGASAGSGVAYSLPSLVQPDVYRAFWVEIYSGSQSYTRSYFTHSPLSAEFVDNLWREPVPFNATYQQGLALAYGAGAYVWLSHPAGVWRAPLITGTGLDLTADVLLATCKVGSGLSGTGVSPVGHALVHLRNDHAAYATPGAGSIAALQRGSQLAIDLGYKTTTGNEVSVGPAWWIESLEHLATTGKAELVLRADDGWGLLSRWIARRQFAWVAGSLTVYQILRWVFARAGLDFSAILGGASPAATNLLLAFTIHPGTSGLAAVRALLAKIPDAIIFQGAAGAIWNPAASDASTYSYGQPVGADLVSAHKIQESRFAISNQQVNHAQVFGTGVFNESFSWTELELAYNRIAQAHDAGLVTAAEALARATAILRESAIESSHDVMIVAPNVGQEVYDVIAVTEPRANLTAAKRRVIELTTEYQPSKAVYKQTLTLGAP